jgi:hypothetical protein
MEQMMMSETAAERNRSEGVSRKDNRMKNPSGSPNKLRQSRINAIAFISAKIEKSKNI